MENPYLLVPFQEAATAELLMTCASSISDSGATALLLLLRLATDVLFAVVVSHVYGSFDHRATETASLLRGAPTRLHNSTGEEARVERTGAAEPRWALCQCDNKWHYPTCWPAAAQGKSRRTPRRDASDEI